MGNLTIIEEQNNINKLKIIRLLLESYSGSLIKHNDFHDSDCFYMRDLYRDNWILQFNNDFITVLLNSIEESLLLKLELFIISIKEHLTQNQKAKLEKYFRNLNVEELKVVILSK